MFELAFLSCIRLLLDRLLDPLQPGTRGEMSPDYRSQTDQASVSI